MILIPAVYDLGTARGRIVIDTADLTRASAAFTSVGKGLLGIGVVAGAAFGVVVKTAATFEKTIDAAGAVLGKTAAQMKPVSDVALKIGQDTKFSAQEVAVGINELAKAGLSIEEIVGGAARGVADLAAAAGDMGLKEAADIALAAMKTFNIPAQDLSRVADSLAGAANASLLEVEDLGVTLRYVGGTAAAMGVEIEELNAVLALLGDRNIRGSTAGTSLRGVLLSLAGASGPAKKVLKQLGIITEDGSNKFFDAAGNMKSMRDVMQVLQDATKHLSQEQRVAAFNAIFQRRAMASALFMAEAGAKGYDKYFKAVSRVSATDVAAAKLDNLAGDVEKLRSNLETLLIKAGTPFQKQLREWTQGLTRLVQWLAALSPTTQRAIMKFIAYTAVIFTAMGVTSLMIGQVIKFARAMKALGAAMKWLAARTGLLLLLDKLRYAMFALRYHIVTKLIPALRALSLAMVASPAGLLLTALTLLAGGLYLLYKRWKPFQRLVDETWQNFQRGWDIVKSVVARIVRAIPGALEKVGEAFGKIGGAVGAAWNTTIRFFRDLPGKAAGLAGRVGRAVGRALAGAGGATVSFFAGLPEKVAYFLGFVSGRAIRWAAKFLKEWNDFWQSVADAVQDWFEKLPGRVIGSVNKFWDDNWERFHRGKTRLVGEVQSLVGEVAGWFERMPGVVVSHVDRFWDENWAKFHHGKTIVVGEIQDMVNKVVEWFRLLPGRTISAIVDWAPRLWQISWSAGDSAFRGFLSGIGSLLSYLKDLPGRMLADIAGLGTSFYKKFESIAGRAWAGFRKGLFGSPKTKIEYALLDLMSFVKGYNVEMGREMAKLQGMSFDKMGAAPVATLTAVGAGAGVGASPPAKVEQAAPEGSPAPAIGQVVIHNPKAEAAEDSLFKTGQELAYLGAFG